MSKQNPNPFATEAKFSLLPEPVKLAQRFKRNIVDRFYGGESRQIRRFAINGTQRFFYLLKTQELLKVGANELLALDEDLQPVRLKVNVSYSVVTGGGGTEVSVEKATLKELGLDEKALEVLAQRVLQGVES